MLLKTLRQLSLLLGFLELLLDALALLLKVNVSLEVAGDAVQLPLLEESVGTAVDAIRFIQVDEHHTLRILTDSLECIELIFGE